jgi:hypothetical protein
VSGEDGIRHVVVAAAGTRRLVSLVRRGCASIESTGGSVTIVSLSTLVERIAARCSLSEAWQPMLESEDVIESRMPAIAEALLVCPSTVDLQYEILVDWTTASVVETVLRAAPDAVVLDRGLPGLRRAVRKHFFLLPARGETKPQDLFFIAQPQPTPRWTDPPAVGGGA